MPTHIGMHGCAERAVVGLQYEQVSARHQCLDVGAAVGSEPFELVEVEDRRIANLAVHRSMAVQAPGRAGSREIACGNRADRQIAAVGIVHVKIRPIRIKV